jgi:hypothetical protein
MKRKLTIVTIVSYVVYFGAQAAGIKWTFTVRDRQIEDPVVKLALAPVLIPMIFILLPLSVPLHLLLKAIGRRGFYDPVTSKYAADKRGFERA